MRAILTDLYYAWRYGKSAWNYARLARKAGIEC